MNTALQPTELDRLIAERRNLLIRGTVSANQHRRRIRQIERRIDRLYADGYVPVIETGGTAWRDANGMIWA